MAKKQKKQQRSAALKAGKGSALVKRQLTKYQPGPGVSTKQRVLAPKFTKSQHKTAPRGAPSSEKLALKARRKEEQAARERAKAAEYAAERGQLPPLDVQIAPATFAVDAPPQRDEGDLRWLFAMDHERDAKRVARQARQTAALRAPAASFEALEEDSDEDDAPPPPPAPVAPPLISIAAPTFALPGQDFDDI